MFQPPKREFSQLAKADAVVVSNDLPSMNFKLPELRLSPILCSFLDQTNASPSVSQMPSTPTSMAPLATSPERKGHSRRKSSPATPYFSGWGKDNMPPLPSVPLEPALYRATWSAAGQRCQADTYSSVSQMPSTPSSMHSLVGGEDATRVRPLRATMPPHGMSPRKGHKRYPTSPAVSYLHRWDKDNMPPLPPMPANPLKLIAPGH